MARKDKQIQEMMCDDEWDETPKDYRRNESRREKRKKKEKERNDNFVVDTE